MKAYHETNHDSLEAALQDGLVRTSRGDKGDDQLIIKTDGLLDEHCPELLKKQGVNRDANLYAYVRVNDSIIDITNGEHIPVDTFVASSSQRVLELEIDPRKCFVSDLDAYDALKSAIEAEEDQATLDQLAINYWNSVVHLPNFDPSTIRRPEIMITYDIPPEKIKVL